MRDRLRSNYRGNVGGVPAAEPKVPEYWRIEPALNFGLHTLIAATATQKAMSETSANDIEYRGYTLTAVQYGPGWRVQIYPGAGHTAYSRLGSYKGAGVCESTGNYRSPPFGLNSAAQLKSTITSICN